MSVTNLDALFRPTSVAVIGASNKPRSPGSIVMRNLLSGRFLGPVMPVTATDEAVSGVLTYKDVDTLPITPDLAVICTPPNHTPDYIRKLGKRGTRAAIIIGPGFATLEAEERGQLEYHTREAAKHYGMRLLGPNCMGLISPSAGLNASLAHTDAAQGRIAFVTQSDSLFTTALDWAQGSGIGFSHFISLGDQLDVNFAAVLDYLGSDTMTRSILLYVESICDARSFMSAARASARNKPILVIKPGGNVPEYRPEQACALRQEDADSVYDVAFRRAGIVRVNSVDGLFDGARTLVRTQTLFSDGLAILANGRSVGLLAADACVSGGGVLAELAEDTRKALAGIRSSHRPGQNPVVLHFDADAQAYEQAIKALLRDPSVAAVLVLHVPFAEVPSEKIAEAVAHTVSQTKRVVLTSWLGTESDRASRQIFRQAGVPTFDTPDKAVSAYLHMVTYRRNQQLLMESPDSLPADFFPDTEKARTIVAQALAEKRYKLSEAEARGVLAAYGVPVVETRTCASAREAVQIAEELGFPVALKVRSPQVPQPFIVGGVMLDIETPEQLWEVAPSLVSRVHRHMPDAYIDGFVVQQMGRRPGAHELFVGAFIDPIFGPVVRFGHGGMAFKVIRDTAVALPPLNMSLARELISRTRIARLLSGAGPLPAADVDDICLTLIQVTQLMIDVPQITDLEINPLFADDKGVLALGAQIKVARTTQTGPERLAIRPYPKELEEAAALKDGSKVLLRPIRPEDAPAHFDFVKSLTADDLRLRFFGAPREFEFADMASFTQIDYDREMAFIATRQLQSGDSETLGVVRTSTKPDNSSAEYAIIVRGDMKGKGLGRLLLEKMIRYVKSRGTKILEAQTLPENKAMIGLSQRLGFIVRTDYEDDIVEMKLTLNP
ncbi:MAG: bifunctional acetate--CoA ligase family protein/GNAT family N-acetyltransferase [Desulfocurvibacter africanus]